ncbi:MAG: alpha/beta fold hydrolase [Myxococcaceae bacterium]
MSSPHQRRAAAATPRLFDLRLPALPLVRGGTVEPHLARGFWWGPETDLPALTARTHALSPAEFLAAQAQEPVRRRQALPWLESVGAPELDESVPSVLLVHALTGDARAGGPGGWWEPLVGPGRALDPARVRILCFGNLGSCYGSSGPLDEGFPADAELTPWDIARALLQAVDALGLERLALVGGGSLGGMVSLCVGALGGPRVERLLPLTTSAASSAWVVAWNHVQRSLLRLDPGWPADVGRGLEVARQVGMLTYRAELGLEAKQGRHLAGEPGFRLPYRVQGWLEHQGQKLRRRFDARPYLLQAGAMDHHDLDAVPPGLGAGVIRASSLVVGVDTDQLFTPAQVEALARRLRAGGAHVEHATLRSTHGHDAFLLEWDALATLVTRALSLPAGGQDS